MNTRKKAMPAIESSDYVPAMLSKVAKQLAEGAMTAVDADDRIKTRQRQIDKNVRAWAKELKKLDGDRLELVLYEYKQMVQYIESELARRHDGRKRGRAPIAPEIRAEATAMYDLLTTKGGLKSDEADQLIGARFKVSVRTVQRYRSKAGDNK